MAGETQARKRKIREKVKDAGSGDSGDEDFEGPAKEGSTCASVVVLVLLLGGTGVLLTLISIHSGAVDYGGPPAPQRPLAQPAEVVVERSGDSSQPPQPQGGDSPAGTILAANTESATADDPAQAAPPVDGAAAQGAAPAAEHTAEPGRPGSPPPPPPPPQQQQQGGDFRLEGSEEAPLDAHLGHAPMRKEVRVRQMLRVHTHADGSITEEVVSEQILQPGDEGYDDLGKEPVTVAVHSGPAPAPTKVKPMMTTTADENDYD